MTLLVDFDRGEIGVGRQQADAAHARVEALDGDFVVDARDDDAAILGVGAAMHGDEVAIEDAGITHARTAHTQQVVGAWAEQVGIDGVLRFDVFGSEDGAAGGDLPDPEKNDKFAHTLAFLDEIGAWGVTKKPTDRPAILLGDLNIAPYEHDVWSHKQLLDVVSHTPIETTTLEKLRSELGWTDAARTLRPEPEKLYSWWSYRAQDWAASNKGRRLDHIWLSDGLKPALRDLTFLREARGWERPSDHVPVTVTLDL